MLQQQDCGRPGAPSPISPRARLAWSLMVSLLRFFAYAFQGKMTTTFLGITVLSDLYVLILVTITMAFGKASCYDGGTFGTLHARTQAGRQARTHKPIGRHTVGRHTHARKHPNTHFGMQGV